MGKQWKQCQTLFWGAPKSLQMVIAAMKLKDVSIPTREARVIYHRFLCIGGTQLQIPSFVGFTILKSLLLGGPWESSSCCSRVHYALLQL